MCARVYKNGLFHTAAYLKHYAPLMAFVRKQGWACAKNYDQGCLNEYVKHAGIVTTRLPLKYNWKPYWVLDSKDPSPRILHFHGPKPQHILRISHDMLVGRDPAVRSPAVYVTLFKRNVRGMLESLAIYHFEDPLLRLKPLSW